MKYKLRALIYDKVEYESPFLKVHSRCTPENYTECGDIDFQKTKSSFYV